MDEETRALVIMAFSCGYHAGHEDTVEGNFSWCREGTKDTAEEWLADAETDGTFEAT